MGRFSTIFNENGNVGNIDISDEAIQKEFADVKGMDFPYEPTMEGAAAINAFAEEEYFDICQECGFNELKYFANNRVEMPVNEAFGDGGFLDKVVQFFKSIGNKIKSLFDKFLMMLNRFIIKDKDFVKKYGNKIKSASTSGVEFKGFNFSISENPLSKAVIKVQKWGDVASSPESILALHKDSKSDEIASKIRGAALGQSELSASEYSKELFKLFRSGEESKVDLTSISPDNIVSEISSAKQDKKDALNAYNEFKKFINTSISEIEKIKKELQKETGSTENGNHQRAYGYVVDDLKLCLSTLQTYNGAYLTAIKARNRQNKGLGIKLITHSSKESYEFGSSNEMFI